MSIVLSNYFITLSIVLFISLIFPKKMTYAITQTYELNKEVLKEIINDFLKFIKK